MNKIKLYLKPLMIFYISFIAYLILVTLFYNFDIISYKIMNIISIITIMLLFLILGINTARKSERKGYINGLLIGLINVIIIFLLSLITKNNIDWSSILYYGLLIFSSMIGGIIGINKKKN